MNSFKKSELLTIGFMMFSIFFGAGNLIFPPQIGLADGTRRHSGRRQARARHWRCWAS